MKKLSISLLILCLLNLLDYIFTLLNLNNFEEANPIANLILQSEQPILWLTLLKLIIVPLLLFVLYKYHNMRLVKVASIL